MTDGEALACLMEAFFRGRFFLDPHVRVRMKERNVTFHDIKAAVTNCSRAEPYIDPERRPTPPATSWRIEGSDLDGELLVLGVDLVQDHLGSHATVVTVY